MKSVRCVLAVALGAGLVCLASGCAIQPASNEADPNAAEVSPGPGIEMQTEYHKIGSPGGQGGSGGQSVYPWPSPWYDPHSGMSADMTSSEYGTVNAAAQAEQTQVSDTQAQSTTKGHDVARGPNFNEANTAPNTEPVLRRKP